MSSGKALGPQDRDRVALQTDREKERCGNFYQVVVVQVGTDASREELDGVRSHLQVIDRPTRFCACLAWPSKSFL